MCKAHADHIRRDDLDMQSPGQTNDFAWTDGTHLLAQAPQENARPEKILRLPKTSK